MLEEIEPAGVDFIEGVHRKTFLRNTELSLGRRRGEERCFVLRSVLWGMNP